MINRAMPAGYGPLAPSGARSGVQLSPGHREAKAAAPLPWLVAAPLIVVLSALMWLALYWLITLV